MKKEETNMGREGERLQLAIGSKSYLSFTEFIKGLANLVAITSPMSGSRCIIPPLITRFS